MIVAKITKDKDIELSDKKSTVVLRDNVVVLNGQDYVTPGEYEVGGVELIRSANAALLVWERLQIAYIFSLSAPTEFEKSQFSSCDVVIFDGATELTKGNATPILEEYDPRVLVVSSGTPIEAGFKDSLKLQESNIIKLAMSGLPEEGRDNFLLT